MTQQASSAARGWTVTLAALAINLVLGVLYAWSVLGKALAMEWKWTKTQAALPFAVATASFAIMMIFAGRAQDKIGPRLVAMLGGVMLGLGLFSSAFAHSPGVMLITFGIIGGVGIGLGYSATTPPSIKWFPPARKGMITGIVVSGVGLAAVWMSPLTQYLLRATSISSTFMILGAGTVVIVCILSLFLRNPPAGVSPVPVAAAVPPANVAGAAPPVLNYASPAARPGRDWHEMLATPQFYLLWLMYVMGAAAGLMIISNVATIAKEQAKWEAGFVPVIMLAIFNTVGRVAGGFVSDRIGRTNTIVLAFLLQAVNMFCFSHYTTAALLTFGAAYTGLCYGTIFTLMPAATADFYGLKNLGVNYGIVFTGFGVAGVLGSLVGGRVRDILGSYSMAYTIVAVMLLAGAVLAFVTRPPKTEQAR
ncbi:MAG: OFA family MFS transporter [Opitutales bacterium]